MGGEHSVSIEEVEPDVFEFTTRWTTYPEVMRERLELKLYEPSPSDMEMEICPSCDKSRIFCEFSWNLALGIITNERTGYRMTILGPGLLPSSRPWSGSRGIPSPAQRRRRSASW